MALPNEAAEAEEMLKDDSQLLQVVTVFFCFLALLQHCLAAWMHVRQICTLTTHALPDLPLTLASTNLFWSACLSTAVMQAYESLAILEGTSSLAQQALQSGAKLKLLDTHNLNAYFNKVSQAASS